MALDPNLALILSGSVVWSFFNCPLKRQDAVCRGAKRTDLDMRNLDVLPYLRPPYLVEQELREVGLVLGVLVGALVEHVLAVVHDAVEEDDARRLGHGVNRASSRLRENRMGVPLKGRPFSTSGQRG